MVTEFIVSIDTNMDNNIEQIIKNWPKAQSAGLMASEHNDKERTFQLTDDGVQETTEERDQRTTRIRKHIYENMSETEINEMDRWLSMFRTSDDDRSWVLTGTQQSDSKCEVDEESDYDRAMRVVTK